MRLLLCVMCAALCIHAACTGNRVSPATSYQSPEADRTAETDILKVHPGSARTLLGRNEGVLKTTFNAGYTAGYQAATKALQSGESPPTPPPDLPEAAHDPQAAETSFNAGYTAGYQAAMKAPPTPPPIAAP